MKALLLAAGFGTRLRPLTNTIPKCLVPIRGKPLLEIWLERLSKEGISPFLVNTHYLPKVVEEFINTSNYKDVVTIAYEPELLGTAGTLMANIDFFEGGDALLIHADNYCLADFGSFLEAHQNRPQKCVMTMMTFQTDNPSSCGILEIDEEGVVIKMYEKQQSPPGNLANGAIYILSADLLKQLKPGMTDFSTEILPLLMCKIYTYETKETFLDIGTPETYMAANI